MGSEKQSLKAMAKIQRNKKIDNIDDEEFDNLLNEIDENEKKYDMQTKNKDNVDWNEIMEKIRANDANFIKNIINSKQIGVNAQNPNNGRTLLIYAVIIGNFDLVKGILNNGANVSIKDEDGLDALDYAIKFGQYKITELVFYRTLSGKTGNDLKRISTEIHAKNKEAEYIKNKSQKLIAEITQFIINAIKERAPFDPSMLFYAWHFNENSLTSPLWSAMMETYQQILSDTKDKNGWKWLKEQFINSLIWFLPHPNAEEEKEENAMESTLKKTLFYELLKRVRTESKKQSDLLLKHKIDSIKSEHGNDWQQ